MGKVRDKLGHRTIDPWAYLDFYDRQDWNVVFDAARGYGIPDVVPKRGWVRTHWLGWILDEE